MSLHGGAKGSQQASPSILADIKRHPMLAEVIQDTVELYLDTAESQLMTLIANAVSRLTLRTPLPPQCFKLLHQRPGLKLPTCRGTPFSFFTKAMPSAALMVGGS